MSKECKICNTEMDLTKTKDSYCGGVRNIFWCPECGSVWIRTQNASTREWIEYWNIPKRQLINKKQ
jgi:predicted RNA-binding Zn-ribbon protein involved in translation (DUF1610 family)